MKYGYITIAVMVALSLLAIGGSWLAFERGSKEEPKDALELGVSPRILRSSQVGTGASANRILSTDGSISSWIVNAGGSGGSNWFINANGFLAPTTTKSIEVNAITASSSTATSTFKGHDDVFGRRCFDTTDCITAWTDITASDAITEVPSGTVNGSNKSFTLANTPSDDDNVLISVNGQTQRNGTDVTISGTAVTFTIAPETGWTLFAHYNKTSSVFAPGLNNTVVTKTGNYTITNNDGTILMNNSSLATSTLPTAVGVTGQIYTIKKINSASVNVIVDGNGTETIDGSLTAVLTVQYEAISVISDGANWLIF